MTIVSEFITTAAGDPDDRPWSFVRVLPLSEDDDGTGIVTNRPITTAPNGGVLTTPDLEPGSYIVRHRDNEYPITLPHSATPIRLWPLIVIAATAATGIDGGTAAGDVIDGGAPDSPTDTILDGGLA